MDILKDKQGRSYEYTSRYSAFPFYYNTEDDKYIYGITKQLGQNTPYTLHELKDYDTVDTLALKYYGRPDLYWVICDFNRIQDPYINLLDRFTSLKIPTISSIYFKN